MSYKAFTKTLSKTVDELSQEDSYKEFRHEHTDGVPLPSGEVLHQIVDIAHGIIFPGYYGNSSVNKETIKYHLGVEIERLYTLLVTQIQAGLSFSNFEESAAFVSTMLAASASETSSIMSMNLLNTLVSNCL